MERYRWQGEKQQPGFHHLAAGEALSTPFPLLRMQAEWGCWEFPGQSPCAGKEVLGRTSLGFVLNSNEWHAKVKFRISYFSKATLMGSSS